MYIIFVLLIQVIFLLIYLYQLGYLPSDKFSPDDIFNIRMITTIVVLTFGFFQIIAISEFATSIKKETITNIRLNGLPEPEKINTNENKHTDM